MKPVTILFGAFDRHNFGDLLFAHIAVAVLRPLRLVFAGLADADLRPAGGHRVQSLPALLDRLPGRPINLVHAGGELLTCSDWQAAVMLLAPAGATALATALDANTGARTAWARARLHSADLAPYVAAPRSPARTIYLGVGGVDLDGCDPAMRREVLDKLGRANGLGVRDRRTQAALASAGMDSRLMPDPAALTARLLHSRIERHARSGAPADMRRAFRNAYLAVQFSADFGDDATLDAIAAALDEAAQRHGCGVVFFRAGAAPWHDDADCYRRVMRRMSAPARMMHSVNLWDICSLISCARAYAGSSLHGRIIAMAYGLPRVNLRPPGEDGGAKQEAYAATWDLPGMPGVVAVQGLPAALAQAMATDVAERQALADRLASRCLEDCAALACELDLGRRRGRGCS